MSTLLQDLRYAARSLRKSPGFAAIAVLTLALGIGANTAIFSVISSVLLQPLPYGDTDRVVAVWNSFRDNEQSSLSAPELVDYREGIRSFEELAAYRQTAVNLTGEAEPERLSAGRVTANLFPVLGTEAMLGRTFTAEEDVPGGDNVVVLGYSLWQRRFGGDPAVVGSTVRVNGKLRTVVGVMPPSFRLPIDYETEDVTQLWVPLALDLNDLGGRGYHNLHAVARLRPGATPEQANAELRVLTQRWLDQGIEDLEGFTAFTTSVKEEVTGDIRPALLILLGAVGFVLLIACANVANLLLVRADQRRKEMAVRAALGAARGRIMSQLLTESAVLATLGGALGLLLAHVGVRTLVALNPASVPRLAEASLDARVLAFTGLVTLLTGALFGAMPALRASRPDLVGPLKEGGRSSALGRSGQRFRRTLVAAEIALSVVLVIGAGLMVRSFWQLQQIELGLNPENVLTLRLSLPAAEYPEAENITAFYSQLLERVEALPGVRSAGAAAILPLASTVGDWGIDIDGRAEGPDENFSGYLQVVTPGFFETMGFTRVDGRFLEDADRPDGLPAVVISEAMARQYWPGESALGRRFRIRGREGPWFTVVGVVGNVRYNAVVEEALPVMYFPHAQLPLFLGGVSSMALVVKTLSDPLTAIGAVREAIRSLDPSLPVSEVRSMEQIVNAAFSEPRFIMLLLAVFAGVALILGAIGIYGVIAYMVSQRTHEIGVRMALGARAGDVRQLVVQQGAMLALIGVALGLAGAFLTTRVLSSLLYEVSTTDPVTYAAVAMLLGAVALLASYLPARRATRIDPMAALRAE
jgi:putative ABC transport system permease protein